MPEQVVALIGVYDADGTVLGEVSYFLKARVGRAHSALCDITHGRVHERADWRSSTAHLPVPFTTYHRDDQPDAVRAVGPPPLVVAVTAADRHVVVADGTDLDRCAGSPDRLIAHLDAALAANDLTWPDVDAEPITRPPGIMGE